MKLSTFIKLLEDIAPPEIAEEFDHGKIGLIVPGATNVKKIATALDATPHVIRKAARLKVQALIVHHTLIWNPVTAIDEDLADSLRVLLENKISLYVMHTNFDRAEGGVNDTLADILGVSDIETLGLARVGRLPEQSLGTCAEQIAAKLGTEVEMIGDPEKKIARVVTAAGSAFREALPLAKRAGADVLISSELRHDVIRQRGDVALISAPHYFTEAPAMMRLSTRLSENLKAEFIDDPPEIRVIRP